MIPTKSELPTENRPRGVRDPGENIILKRTTAGRCIATLICAALLLLFSAFYGWFVVEERISIPTVCLTGGTLVVVIAMSIDVLLVRSDLTVTTQHQPGPDTPPPAIPTREERITHETNAYSTELLSTLNLLRDVTPRRGSFGPRMACTIVKDDIARPGFFVPASAPSYVGEPFNPGMAARRRPPFPVPVSFVAPPPGPGPYHAYLDDGTDEVFYDNPVSVNQAAQTEAGAQQQAMGQTRQTAPVLPTHCATVETEVTIETPPPEMREQPSSAPSGEDRDNAAAAASAAATERPRVGRDVPDCTAVLRELLGLPLVAPPNTPYNNALRAERGRPVSGEGPVAFPPAPYGIDNVNTEVEQAQEAIYEEPDNLPQHKIFVFDDMTEEEDDQPGEQSD